MSKGLEALTELKFQVGNITYYTHDLQATAFKVRDSGLFETIEKELNALKIINIKRVNVELLMKVTSAKDYNKFSNVVNQSHNLGDREFDLLKEILL